MTTVLVQVVTKAPGLSPAEIERFVTFPIEFQLIGAPGLTDIRSLSKVGLVHDYRVFRDDIDIYLARQVVLERVLEVQELLPPGADFAAWFRTRPGWERSISFIWKVLTTIEPGFVDYGGGADGTADA